jgi:hypothetical protein
MSSAMYGGTLDMFGEYIVSETSFIYKLFRYPIQCIVSFAHRTKQCYTHFQ